jgi:predicted ribosome quality control (RQC) complex YloA/Tae2 family protein
MKIEKIFFHNIQKSFTFYISENENEPFKMLDLAKPTDIWFHAENYSSCHVIVLIDVELLSKKEKQTIYKRSAFLCKFHTLKLRGITDKLSFIYTKIENIKRTNKPGCVITENTKWITI